MNYEPYLRQVSEFLVMLGVPHQHSGLAALGLIYLTITLLVLLVVLLLVQRRAPAKVSKRPEPTQEPAAEVEAPAAEPPAEAKAEPEVALPEEPVEAGEVPAPAVEALEAEPVLDQAGLFERLRSGLSKTRGSLLGRVDALFSGAAGLDDAFVEEFEEILITADFGMQATQDLVQAVTVRAKAEKAQDAAQLRAVLEDEIRSRLQGVAKPWSQPDQGPLVIMVVGVNGVGKTTTIGKLAKQYADQGKRVVLGAGDTFRAAAAEQLQVWGERSGADVIRHAEGSDPAAVAFDATKAAVARKADVLILDTAGRLHTKVNLMEELKKVRRVVEREIPGAPHETLLVLDATTGQNALVQAKMFQEAVEVSGIVLTKLDGTAKGGIVVAIGSQMNLPVRFIGIGEGVSDLRPFDADEFVQALFRNA